MVANLLHGIVVFLAIFYLFTVKAEEQDLSSHEEFDIIIENELVNEDEQTRLENSVDLQEDETASNEMMKRSHFRPRPYLPAQPCPYRGSPNCCGGKLIDVPSMKMCCHNRIVLRRLARSMCKRNKGTRISRCGRTYYNRNVERCCYNQVIPRRAKCKRKRCKPSRSRYITYNQQCCHGRVLSKSVPCSPYQPYQTRLQCGNVRYDPMTRKCCSSHRVVPRHLSCPTRLPCGHTFYNPHSQQCCNRQVLHKIAPCIPFLCGGLHYNPQTHQCCNGQIVFKFQKCPGPSPWHQFCGGNFVNPSRQKCCHGNVVAPLTSTCERCGASFFVPYGFRCCHRTQIIPAFVQCNV